MDEPPITGKTAKKLQDQSLELQRLIEEAQRIKRMIDERLIALRRAGDSSVESRKPESGRKSPRGGT
jgi:hypothetical protein